jgi:iron(III) transport system substrate-binding protein
MQTQLFRQAAMAIAGITFLSVGTAQSADILTYSGSDRTAKLIAGAKKEGQLTLYTALTVNQAVRPLVAGFQKKYPFIKMEYWRGSSRKIAQKVNAERRADSLVVDVMEGSGLAMIMVKAKAVAKFTTPASESVPKQFRDPNDQWVPSRFSYFGMAYNTKIVPPGTQPKTYQDLLDPKWKGKIAWRIGSESGAPLFITNIRQHLGEAKAKAYFEKLTGQGIVNFRGSARTLVNRVVQGEYPLAIQIFAHHPVISAKKGAPVAVQMMEPIPSINGTIMVPKRRTAPQGTDTHCPASGRHTGKFRRARNPVRQPQGLQRHLQEVLQARQDGGRKTEEEEEKEVGDSTCEQATPGPLKPGVGRFIIKENPLDKSPCRRQTIRSTCQSHLLERPSPPTDGTRSGTRRWCSFSRPF